MRFVIDFDYTLFNTQALRDAYIHMLTDVLAVSEEQYYAAEKEISRDGKLFNLYNLLHELFTTSDDRDKALALIEAASKDGDKFLYPEVLRELQALQQHQHELHLLTFGDKDWQEYKVRSTQLPDLFTSITYVDTKKTDAVELFTGEDIVCVNDRGSEIDELWNAFPEVTYVWIAREGDPYSEEAPTAPHIQIQQLSDISL